MSDPDVGTALYGAKVPPVRSLETETTLVCEALVREMRDATRWQTIKEAWEALLAVRRMSKQMLEEHQQVLETGRGSLEPDDPGSLR